MTWLSTRESAGHLGEAVSHFNEALDLLERDGTEADATRCLSDALNEIRTAWSRFEARESTGGAGTLQAMLTQALCPEAQTELLSSDEVLDLLSLEPRVPDQDDASRAPLLERLAELIPVAGSNRAPGDDSDSTEVGKVVIPVQLLLVNLLLDRPDERLVIYGTLAPGKSNHNVIADLRGEYRDCAVHGRISEVDGFPHFTWARSDASLGALLFSSKQLPGMWGALDRFEGDGYKRRLIPATIDSGLSIASIYLDTADDVWPSGER
jgi:gamma-glutamylcyclotransferase (GGCT)/AIG2-like uncharacterized protein YtfP